MTPESLCAELRDLYQHRNAIDIIAENNDCTYTDIILLIGCTKEFNKFCAMYNGGNKQISEAVPFEKRTQIDWDAMTKPILRLYQAGISYAEIGERLGISKDSVGNCLKREGFHDRRNIKLKNEWKPDIIARHKSGEPTYLIAHAYGISRGSVEWLLKGVEK